jgi:hypothetical protein
MSIMVTVGEDLLYGLRKDSANGKNSSMFMYKSKADGPFC